MAMSNELIECVICSQILRDPRALPCGHSYCGPPRMCLNGLKSAEGGLRCAICRMVHNMNPGDIKPLYGIRDYIEGTSEGNNDESCLPCSVHPNKKYTFWCSSCNVMVCNDCIEYEHDDHSFRKLKRYLVDKIEEQLGKPLLPGFSEFKSKLKNAIDSKKLDLELSKSQVASHEKEIDDMLYLQVLLDQYEEISKNNCQDALCKETDLLARISNSELIKNLSWSQRDKNIEVDHAETSTLGTQTESLSVVSVSSATVLSTTSRSIQASESCSDSEGASSQPVSTTELSDSLVDCECGFKHKETDLWNSPLTLSLLIYVIERNPLRTGPCSRLVCCPFRFYFTLELVNQNNSRRHKMVRITVYCAHLFNKELPPFTFQYQLFLLNVKKINETVYQTGNWVFPRQKNIIWDVLPYSELVNPALNWICDENYIEIQLRLLP